MSQDLIQHDAWRRLRELTPARVGLGRAGQSLPTHELLAFCSAHAQARDAVHLPLDVGALRIQIKALGLDTWAAASAAPDRPTYLLRPDLGRRLSRESASELDALATTTQLPTHAPTELLIVVADGLSAAAVERQVPGLLAELQVQWPEGWRWAPVVVATQARVALGDDVGQRLHAPLVAVLIGERPGLSSPDSLGIYLTHAPRVGRSDAERNCISNVRPEGLSHADAARKLLWLARESRALGQTGVGLKDLSELQTLPGTDAPADPAMLGR